MSIGNQIMAMRKERQLTQEQFGSLFHVTRQTGLKLGERKELS